MVSPLAANSEATESSTRVRSEAFTFHTEFFNNKIAFPEKSAGSALRRLQAKQRADFSADSDALLFGDAQEAEGEAGEEVGDEVSLRVGRVLSVSPLPPLAAEKLLVATSSGCFCAREENDTQHQRRGP